MRTDQFTNFVKQLIVFALSLFTVEHLLVVLFDLVPLLLLVLYCVTGALKQVSVLADLDCLLLQAELSVEVVLQDTFFKIILDFS